jgi:putative hydrolase of the HAD superfamily
MGYDAVFWDVGGVLIDTASIVEAQRTFLERAVDRYELDQDLASARHTWRETLSQHFAGRDGREYRTARAGRRKAAEAVFGGDPPADWRDLFETVTTETVRPNPGAAETLRRIDEAGLYQAVVSDADEGVTDRFEQLGIGAYVADVTTSEEVGYVKPDPRMFETAFEKARTAGIEPERGVMVGDKYENDMVGASSVGLATAAYGADDGPAVDHQLGELTELLEIVGVESN